MQVSVDRIQLQTSLPNVRYLTNSHRVVPYYDTRI